MRQLQYVLYLGKVYSKQSIFMSIGRNWKYQLLKFNQTIILTIFFKWNIWNIDINSANKYPGYIDSKLQSIIYLKPTLILIITRKRTNKQILEIQK